jgi:hypothetical protein
MKDVQLDADPLSLTNGMFPPFRDALSLDPAVAEMSRVVWVVVGGGPLF